MLGPGSESRFGIRTRVRAGERETARELAQKILQLGPCVGKGLSLGTNHLRARGWKLVTRPGRWRMRDCAAKLHAGAETGGVEFAAREGVRKSSRTPR